MHALNNLGTSELAAGDPADGPADAHQQPGTGARGGPARARRPGLLQPAATGRRPAPPRRRRGRGRGRAWSTASTGTSTRGRVYLQGWQARLLLDRGDYAGRASGARACCGSASRSRSARSSRWWSLALVEARPGRGTGGEPLERAAAAGRRHRRGATARAVRPPRCELAWLAGDVDSGRAPRPPRCGRWCRTPTAVEPRGGRHLARPEAAARSTGLAGAAVRAGGGRPVARGRRAVAALGCPFEQALALARSGEQDGADRGGGCFDALGAVAAAATGPGSCSGPAAGPPRGVRGASAAGIRPGSPTRETEVLALLSEGSAGRRHRGAAGHLPSHRRAPRRVDPRQARRPSRQRGGRARATRGRWPTGMNG